MKAIVEGTGKFASVVELPGGANGYAFQAQHLTLGRACFLKLIDFPKEGEDTILREPRSLVDALEGNPRCDNIVQLFDAETVTIGRDRYVLLQMEWLTGQNLQERIPKGVIGQQDAVRIGLGILRGLAHLHSKNIIHRDLKPANIVLTNDVPAVPKIADFGSAVQMKAGQTAVSASRHSDLYRPAEAWEATARYDFRSDIYQVSLVLHQLACGAFPVDGRAYLTPAVARDLRRAGKDYEKLDAFERVQAERASIVELVKRESLIDYARPTPDYVSPKLRRIIARATKSDPAQRFSSATEFLNALSRVAVPNWVPQPDGMRADGWQTWDWKVARVSRRSGAVVEIHRARPGSGNFRRYSEFPKEKDAFAAVEAISS